MMTVMMMMMMMRMMTAIAESDMSSLKTWRHLCLRRTINEKGVSEWVHQGPIGENSFAEQPTLVIVILAQPPLL